MCWRGGFGGGHFAAFGDERGEEVVDWCGDLGDGVCGFIGAHAVDEDFERPAFGGAFGVDGVGPGVGV